LSGPKFNQNDEQGWFFGGTVLIFILVGSKI